MAAAEPDASAHPKDSSALEQAFTALAGYDRGSSRGALLALDEAVVAALNNAGRRAWLEQRLLASLQGRGSAVAKDYICSKLVLIGSPQSVPAVAQLLADKQLGPAACNVLERIPGREASEALRASVARLSGSAKVGVINSIRVRRDAESIPMLIPLLGESDAPVASAAAAALGEIGTKAAANALARAQSSSEAVRRSVADARLVCAEALLAAGRPSEAQEIYRALDGSEQSKPIRLAARKGMLQASRTKPKALEGR